VRVYGTPWTYYAPEMWAFDVRPAGLDAAMECIPDDVEILVTHGPPRGVLDRTVDGTRAGSRALASALPRLRSLRAHVFGHIHEGRGRDGVHHNVAVLDAYYRPYAMPVAVTDL
jgi:Icc-related predicted phosphoesterase